MRVDCAVPPDESVTDAVLRDRTGPGGETVAVRLRVPEKPLRLERVIVEVAVEFCVMFNEPGLVVMAKFGTVTVTETVVVRATVPLFPSIVTVYMPEGVEAVVKMVKMDVADGPEIGTIIGLNE